MPLGGMVLDRRGAGLGMVPGLPAAFRRWSHTAVLLGARPSSPHWVGGRTSPAAPHRHTIPSTVPYPATEGKSFPLRRASPPQQKAKSPAPRGSEIVAHDINVNNYKDGTAGTHPRGAQPPRGRRLHRTGPAAGPHRGQKDPGAQTVSPIMSWAADPWWVSTR